MVVRGEVEQLVHIHPGVGHLPAPVVTIEPNFLVLIWFDLDGEPAVAFGVEFDCQVSALGVERLGLAAQEVV